MIKRIKLNNIASFKNEEIINLKKINYFFGGNGAGKTTISKMLNRAEESTPNFSLEWENDNHERVLVFNRYFIRSNMEEMSELKGVYTMGENTIEQQHTIEELKSKINQIDTQYDRSNSTKANLERELNDRKSEFENKCWELKQKYSGDFPEALKGLLNNKSKFAEKCINSFKSKDNSEKIVKEDIYKEYKTLFSKNMDTISELDNFKVDDLDYLDNTSILEESIVGNTSSQIGELIKRLNSADWVRNGISYAQKTGEVCPFCQQPMSSHIREEIESFFDESYKNKCSEIERYLSRYNDFNKYIHTYRERIFSDTSIVDCTSLIDRLETLFTIVERNTRTISKKIELPSQVMSIESIKCYIDDILKEITVVNTAIRKHNALVSDNASKNKCCQKVWLFMISDIETDINNYLRELNNKLRGINALNQKIEEQHTEKENYQTQIAQIESSMSSVVPTINAINDILTKFGFTGFLLKENTEKQGTYKIVRPDGTYVNETLSEGESNFVAFLYFYYLCFGSDTTDGINIKRIIVIDDPISSLDSNVLFIVSSLTKDILQKCRDNNDGISQVLLLTHNAYFHKEVTFWGSRDKLSEKECVYFVIRKNNDNSSIHDFKDNPVKNTYEMMWQEIASPYDNSKSSVFNTMRRILEHYFNIVGGMDYESCINSFEGQDKIICKSLISLINDGSHTIFDDYGLSISPEYLEASLNVFKLIFEKMGHIDHYNMMINALHP